MKSKILGKVLEKKDDMILIKLESQSDSLELRKEDFDSMFQEDSDGNIWPTPEYLKKMEEVDNLMNELVCQYLLSNNGKNENKLVGMAILGDLIRKIQEKTGWNLAQIKELMVQKIGLLDSGYFGRQRKIRESIESAYKIVNLCEADKDMDPLVVGKLRRDKSEKGLDAFVVLENPDINKCAAESLKRIRNERKNYTLTSVVKGSDVVWLIVKSSEVDTYKEVVQAFDTTEKIDFWWDIVNDVVFLKPGKDFGIKEFYPAFIVEPK